MTYHAEILCCVEHRGPDCLCGHFVVAVEVLAGCGRKVLRDCCCHSICGPKSKKQDEVHDVKMGKCRVGEQAGRQTDRQTERRIASSW